MGNELAAQSGENRRPVRASGTMRNGTVHVLVVDDDPHTLESICGLLGDSFAVHAASDVTDGLAKLDRYPIAVLITDQRMNGVGGDGLLAETARRSLSTRVLLTGYSDMGAMVRAVQRGHIYAYIAKPWDPMELRLTLERAVEHHRLMQVLHHERRQLVQLMESVPDVIYFKDEEHRFTRVNRATAELLGVNDAASLIGRGDWDFFPPDEAARIEAEDSAVIQGGRPLVDQIEAVTPPDGRQRWFSTTKVPIEGAGLVGISRDVTERKLAEQRLDAMTRQLVEAEFEKKAFYRRVIQAVTDGKLHLVDAEDVPTFQATVRLDLEEVDNYRVCREELRALGEQAGLHDDAIEDLVLGAGEAVTNAIKHATGGMCLAGLDDSGVVVRVVDQGAGIHADDLPDTLFRTGFSTKISLGLGYTLILKVMDSIWLSTGPEGTILQMVKRKPSEEQLDADLNAFLDRFSS
ncbi:MAG: PAS domain-containing protein [Vulcanimicrobiota bacterium]